MACIEICGPPPSYPGRGMPSLSQSGGVIRCRLLQHLGQRRLCRITSAEQDTQTGGKIRSAE
jgi:hypothetical protein